MPKAQLGLPADTPPTAELKTAQRSWFILLYRLLIDNDTGPRLPTLLLALGIDRVRALLTPQAAGSAEERCAPVSGDAS